MILSHSPDVDPDLFCYETSLSIPPCEKFLYGLLNRINTEGDGFLVRRKKYLDPRIDPKGVFDKLTLTEKKLMLQRKAQVEKHFPGNTPIDFRQYFMPPEMDAEFKELIPQWIKDLGEFSVGVQISREGNLNPTHKGHQRQSSLFFLLQSDDEETRWYRQTADFHVIDFFRIPDYDKVENIVCAKIMPGKWTVFNHKAWHSVHKHNPGTMDRVNINIDFDGVTIDELVNAVKAQEAKRG